MDKNIGVFIALGAGIGTAVGVSIGQIAVGTATGLFVGMVSWIILSIHKRQKEMKRNNQDSTREL